MKFRTKLILGFSVVIFFISTILGIVCYNYNFRRLSEKAAQNLKLYSRQTASNVDFTIDSMKHVTDYILSDQDMLNAMKTLPKYYENGSFSVGRTIVHNDLLDALNSGLAMYYINRNFYRVIILMNSEMWHPVPIPVPSLPIRQEIHPTSNGWIQQTECTVNRS